MLVECKGGHTISLKERKRQRKHSLFYFSSTKTLRRSRMMRGKKVISKTCKALLEDLHKVLRFGIGHSGGHGAKEDAELKNFDVLQETSKDTTRVWHEAIDEDVTHIKTFGQHLCFVV